MLCYPGGAVLLDVRPGPDDGYVAADGLCHGGTLRPYLRPIGGLAVLVTLS